MRWFRPRRPDRQIAALQRRVDDLETALLARDRTIAVLEAERETMSLVLARDRQRIHAEQAAYARQRAEHESDDGQPDQSIRRLTA